MAIAPAGRACAVRGGRAGRRRQLARGCALRSPPVATRGGFAKNSGSLGSARRGGGGGEAAGLQRSPPRPLGAERAGPSALSTGAGQSGPGRRSEPRGLRLAREPGVIPRPSAPCPSRPLSALGGDAPACPAGRGTGLRQRGRGTGVEQGHAAGTAPAAPSTGSRHSPQGERRCCRLCGPCVV